MTARGEKSTLLDNYYVKSNPYYQSYLTLSQLYTESND